MSTIAVPAPERALTTPPPADFPLAHTPECDAAHDHAEVPRGEECADGGCWGIADTAPRTTAVVLTVETDECGNQTVATPAGDLTWVARDSDGGVLDDPHFQLNGRDLGDVWAANQLRAALDALVNQADPEHTARHLRTAAVAPTSAAPLGYPRGSVADVATRLTATTVHTLARICEYRLAVSPERVLRWDISGRSEGPRWTEVTDTDLDDLDNLRRHGLIDGIAPTALGCQVEALLSGVETAVA